MGQRLDGEAVDACHGAIGDHGVDDGFLYGFHHGGEQRIHVVVGERLKVPGLAVRGGMSEAGALQALTVNGAKMLRLDDRLGSIEVGKDADLVVLSGAPFKLDTQVLETWIDGVRVFDRSDPENRRYATGGFAVGNGYPALAATGESELGVAE